MDSGESNRKLEEKFATFHNSCQYDTGKKGGSDRGGGGC